MSFYPLYAGPALRFQRYGPGLQRRGARLRVFTRMVHPDLVERDGSLASNPDQVPQREVVDGMQVERVELPGGWRAQPAYFRKLAQYCRAHRHELDVVQLLNADFLAAPWLLQLRRMGLRLVYTHTLLSPMAPGGAKARLQRLHRRVPLELVDRVVVSSQAMARQIQELGPSTPVLVIPNGVDLERFRPARDETERASVRRELGLDPQWTVALAIGPIIPRKGTDALVEAFVPLCRDFPQARLVLVGPRHDLGRADLREFRERLRAMEEAAPGRVIYTGPVSDVPAYLRAADLLVFPSRREGMPNVVPEAMAAGLPVVMTPFTGLPAEFGKPGEQYLLSSWEPAELRRDIRRLLEDEPLRRAMGEAGRAWVARNLDLEKSLDAYMDLYRDLKASGNGYA